MTNTFAKTRTTLMVLLMALAIVAIVATVVLFAFRADANVVTVANELELNDVLADIQQGKYSGNTIVRLKNDISLEGSLESLGTYTLDLNGHALSYVGSEKAPVITVSEGNLTLTDSGKEATGLITGGKEGGIVVNGGKFALEGATISGNTSEKLGAGIFVAEGAEISVAGAPVVANNTTNGTESNLYLPGETLVFVEDLQADANIGVTLDSARIFTKGYAASSAGKALQINGFALDDDANRIVLVNQEVMAVADDAVVLVDSTTYNTFASGWNNAKDGSIITLLADIELARNVSASKAGLTLDLNGFLIRYTDNFSPAISLYTSNVERMTFTMLDSNPSTEHTVVDPFDDENTIKVSGGLIYGGTNGLHLTDDGVGYLEVYLQGGTIMGALEDGIFMECKTQIRSANGTQIVSTLHLFGGASVIYNQHYGVNTNNAFAMTMQGSTISHNGFGGIYSKDAALTLEGGEICENGHSSTEPSLEPKNYHAGIYQMNSTRSITIRETNISDNTGHGIWVNGSSTTTIVDISGATISGNGGETLPGAYIVGSRISVEGAKVFENGTQGLALTATYVYLTDCTVESNGKQGVNTSATHSAVTGCTITKNGTNGIDYTGTTFNIVKSRISNNTEIGALITISGATQEATIEGSTLNNNGAEGIKSNGVLRVFGSFVEYNGNCGVSFSGSELEANGVTFDYNGQAHLSDATVDETNSSNVYASAVTKVRLTECNVSEARGRGIYLNGGSADMDVEISNSAIFSNGGGINVAGRGGQITIKTTELFDNVTTATDGAGIRISTTHTATTVTLNTVTVNNNQTSLSGGGIYLNLANTAGAATINFDGVHADNNVALGVNASTIIDTPDLGGGGAYLYLHPSAGAVNATIKNSSFDNNVASNGGGGAYIYTLAGNGVSTLTMEKVSFDRNDSQGDAVTTLYGGGGANINLLSSKSNVVASLTDVTFNNNTAVWHGGGAVIEMTPGATNNNEATLTNVQANYNETAEGAHGGLYLHMLKPFAHTGGNNTLTVRGLYTNNNKALNNSFGAGELYVVPANNGNCTLDIKGFYSNNNYAYNDQGAMRIIAVGTYTAGATNNIRNNDVTITVEDAITNNNVSEAGSYGGFYVYARSFLKNARVTLKNIVSNGNSAYLNYGGIYAYSRSDYASGTSYLTADNVEINDNTALTGQHGAGLIDSYNYGVTAYVTSTNTATQEGYGKTEMTLTNFEVHRNTSAITYGLRIYTYAFTYSPAPANASNKFGQAKLTIDGMNSSENKVLDGDGGGLYLHHAHGELTATISNSSFTDNVAEDQSDTYGFGGGMHIYNNNHIIHMSMSNVTMTGNKAVNGGGLSVRNQAYFVDVTTDNTVHLDKNTATQVGGGLYFWKSSTNTYSHSTYTMNGGTINNNVAGNGGGVNLTSGLPTTTDSYNKLKMTGGAQITGNKAEAAAGVLDGESSSIDISGLVTINGNSDYEDYPSNLFLYADNIITVSGTLDQATKIGLSFDFIFNGKVVTSGLDGKGTVRTNFSLDASGNFDDTKKEVTLTRSGTPIHLLKGSDSTDFTEYTDFKSAYDKAIGTDNVIQLMADVYVEQGFTLTQKLTIDLNGYMLLPSTAKSINYLFVISTGGTLTITDSTYGTSKFGNVTHTLINQQTTLAEEVSGGILRSSIHLNGGTLDFQAGIISSSYGTDDLTRAGIYWQTGTLKMTDNAWVAYCVGYGLYTKYAANVTLSAGHFYANAQYGIMTYHNNTNKYTLTISGTVSITHNRVGGIYVHNRSQLNVTGGEILYNTSRAIYQRGEGDVTISGGDLGECVGATTQTIQWIYQADNNTLTGNVTITGSAKIHGDTYGVYMYSGVNPTLTISGGEIYDCQRATFDRVAYVTNPTINMTGGSIHDCSMYGLYLEANGTVTVSGGDIYKNGRGIYLYPRTNGAAITLTVSGTAKIRDNVQEGILLQGYVNTNDNSYLKTYTINFTMSGGTISGNGTYGVNLVARDYYGIVNGVAVKYKFMTSMTMTGGTITGNTDWGINLQAASPDAYSKLILGKGSAIVIDGNGTESDPRNLYAQSYWQNTNYPKINTGSKLTSGYTAAQVSFNGVVATNSRIGISTYRDDQSLWDSQASRTLITWNATNAANVKFFSDIVTECFANGVYRKNHNTTVVPGVTPDCTKTGNLEYWQCNSCKDTFYEQAALHQFDVAGNILQKTEHTYRWTTLDNYNHQEVCDVCSAKGASEKHNYTKFRSTDNTWLDGKYIGTCEVCVKSKTDATHFEYTFDCHDNGGFEGAPQHYSNSWSATTAEHWLNGTIKCDVCGESVSNTAHTFSGEWLSREEGEHFQMCVVCNRSYNLNDLGQGHDLDGIWIPNAEGKHIQKCRGCGAIVEVPDLEHKLDGEWVKNSAGKHLQTCVMCAQTYEIPSLQHKAGAWIDSENGSQHKTNCVMCGIQMSEAHVYVEAWFSDEVGSMSRHCRDCEYVETLDCQHNLFGTVLTKNTSTHWYQCSLCGEHLNEVAHSVAAGSWSPVTTTTHRGTCEVCKQDVVAAHVAQEGYSEYNRNENSHYQICRDCKDQINFQAHDYIWTEAGENLYNGACSVCNLAQTGVTHHFSSRWSTTADDVYHYRACEDGDCPFPGSMYQRDTHKVTMNDGTTSSGGNNGTHTGSCEVCGLTLSQGDHVYGSYQAEIVMVDGKPTSTRHFRVCTVCGAKDTAADNTGSGHTNGVPFVGETTHGKWCAVCHYVLEESNHKFVATDSGDGSTHYQKCNECGAIGTTGNHRWGTSGLGSTETQHYSICNQCGGFGNYVDHENEYVQVAGTGHYTHCKICGHNGDTVAHRYGEYLVGEKGHYRHCGLCEYNSAQVAHTYTANVYEDNAEEHWQLCNVCRAEGEHVEHHFTGVVSNDDGTHSSKCDICGRTDEGVDCLFEILNKNDATHTLKCKVCKYETTDEHDEKKANSDQTAHWNECSVCGHVNDEDKIPHVWSKSATATEDKTKHFFTCTKCDYEAQAVEHNLAGSYRSDSSGHWQMCTACGAAGATAEHVYTTFTKNLESGTHTGQCGTCNYKKTNLECEYKFGVVGQHQGQCKDCEAEIDGEHVYDRIEGVNDQYHRMICECGAVDPENNEIAHKYNARGVDAGDGSNHTYTCEECGWKMTKSHNFSNSYSTDIDGHWYECAECGAKKDYEEHKATKGATPNGDGTHSARCDDCDRLLTTLDCEYTTIQKAGDKTYHTAQCKVCHDEVDELHGWSLYASSSTQHWAKCECGEENKATAEDHRVGDTTIVGDKHTFNCPECGYTSDEENHVFEEGKYEVSDTEHWQLCKICGAESAHGNHNSNGATPNGGTHTLYCDVCKEEQGSENCSYTYAKDNGNQATHKATCEVCEEVIDQAHEFNAKYGKSATQHWIVCDLCSEQQTSSIVSHDFNGYINDGSTHHQYCATCDFTSESEEHNLGRWQEGNGKHWKECEQCDYETEHDDHVYAGGAQSNGNGTHTAYCSVCETAVAGVACSYVSSITPEAHVATCTECGYKVEAAHDQKTFNYDGTHHWHECSVCGYVAEENKTPHDFSGNADKCNDPECEQPSDDPLATAKREAIDAIKAKAEATKAKLNGSEKELLKQMIDKAVKEATDAINHAADAGEITATRTACETEIDGIELRDAINVAQAEIEAKAKDLTDNLATLVPGMASADEATYKAAIEAAKKAALEAIAGAKSVEEVGTKLEQGKEALDGVILSTAKALAEQAIENAATAAKSRVSGSSDAAKLEGLIDKEATRAKNNIKNAESVADVNAAKAEGIEILAGFQAESDPDEKEEESKDRDHECNKVCSECGKCLDPDCDYSACKEKCEFGGYHHCQNECLECGKCLTPNCDHKACKDKCPGHGPQPEDPVEAAKRASKATSGTAKDSALGKVGANSKYADAINTAWNSYIEALEGAETVDAVKEAEEAFMNAINSAILEHAKDSAIADLETKAQQAKDNLPEGLTDEERAKYEDAIDKALEAAKGAIEGATDPSQIEDVMDQVDDKVDDAVLDTGKEIAKDKIQSEADAKKEEIENNPDLSDEDKKALQDIIQEEADRAKGKVDGADSLDEVEEERKRGDDIMQDVVDNPDPELQGQKSEGRNDLDDAANKKKDDIQKKADEEKKKVEDDPNLTDEEKKAKQDEIQKEADEQKKKVDQANGKANDDITKAEDPDQIKDAVNKGKEGIDKAGEPEKQKNFFEKMMDFFKETPMPLGLTTCVLGGMVVIMIILSIAARKPKKK